MNQYFVYGVGFLAQLLFSARLLVQWLFSERAGRVMSPLLFWQLSIVASFILMVYGIL
ncbi:MAG TPA: lauroyl acyltransferase, partial [Desulfobacterales bacterium]|nr:lauroyl acyltransferase [Desulfobacterales bacterium]